MSRLRVEAPASSPEAGSAFHLRRSMPHAPAQPRTPRRNAALDAADIGSRRRSTVDCH
jgi:hypothetical protein